MKGGRRSRDTVASWHVPAQWCATVDVKGGVGGRGWGVEAAEIADESSVKRQFGHAAHLRLTPCSSRITHRHSITGRKGLGLRAHDRDCARRLHSLLLPCFSSKPVPIRPRHPRTKREADPHSSQKHNYNMALHTHRRLHSTPLKHAMSWLFGNWLGGGSGTGEVDSSMAGRRGGDSKSNSSNSSTSNSLDVLALGTASVSLPASSSLSVCPRPTPRVRAGDYDLRISASSSDGLLTGGTPQQHALVELKRAIQVPQYVLLQPQAHSYPQSFHSPIISLPLIPPPSFIFRCF